MIESQVIKNLKEQGDRERQLKSADLGNSEFKFIGEKQAIIRSGGHIFYINIDRPFIHNIGSRIFPAEKDFKRINQLWHASEQERLREKINNTLRTGNYQILYYRRRDANMVYGIVTSHFIFVDPLKFRDQFISEIRKCDSMEELPVNCKLTRNGEVVELFNFRHNQEKDIKLTIGVIYGLNNGYSSYRLFWERKIIKCGNALSNKMSNVKWKHTREISLSDFIKVIVKNTLSYESILVEKSMKAQQRILKKDSVEELLRRFHSAQILKQRVLQKLRDEVKHEGNTEFALSQAFTSIGTHFYRTSGDYYHAGLCIEAGSKMIDSSLNEWLDEPGELIQFRDFRTWGLLLPRKMETTITQVYPPSEESLFVWS